MGIAGERARTDSLRIKLAPSMAERYESAASDFGMPTSTLAAFALSQWMIEYENKAKLSRAAMLELTRKLSEEFSGEKLEKGIAAAVLAMAKAEGMTLDHEAVSKLTAK